MVDENSAAGKQELKRLVSHKVTPDISTKNLLMYMVLTVWRI
jgi:hypothetical protein